MLARGEIPVASAIDEIEYACLPILDGVDDYSKRGGKTALLISSDRGCEPINTMARMTALPVLLERAVQHILNSTR